MISALQKISVIFCVLRVCVYVLPNWDCVKLFEYKTHFKDSGAPF